MANESMRLLYGVHGYGRGHAVRAQAILPELARRHELLVLAGDEAADMLEPDWDVLRVPVLRYRYAVDGHRSVRRTLRDNAPLVTDLLTRGETFRRLTDRIRRFAPRAAVSDSEIWTHHVARSLAIPRISFDHYGIMAYCDLHLRPRERVTCELEAIIYRLMVCAPQRSVVTAFYPGRPRRRPRVRAVGPILRPQVLAVAPSEGDYLLAYFSNASVNYTHAAEHALHELDAPVKVYGVPRTGSSGNVQYRPIDSEAFLRDLAAAHSVLATAGNQLISEAIHYGKPLLVTPEPALEQQLNARYVERWRIGMRTTPQTITSDLLRRFLARRDEFAANIRARRRDGLTEALQAIELAIDELTHLT